MKTKWLKFEYWPTWLFYLPVLPMYLWHAIRLKSLVFFTWVNPSIQYGGFFGEEKDDILDQIPEEYKVPSLCFKEGTSLTNILEDVTNKGWMYPLVVKPNIGERGTGVQIVHNSSDFEKYLNGAEGDLLVQPHVNGEEFGVFVVRCPESKQVQVTSITGKVFMKVIGDGKSSISQLMGKNERFKRQIERLSLTKPKLMQKVLAPQEELIVEPIGNHCLGTEFTNENHLITESVRKVFENIVNEMDGFNYGRFDLRVLNREALKTGQGICIFELNGVASEPGHVYATNTSYFMAIRDVVRHWTYIFQIAKKIKAKRQSLYRTRDIWRVTRRHFRTV